MEFISYVCRHRRRGKELNSSFELLFPKPTTNLPMEHGSLKFPKDI